MIERHNEDDIDTDYVDPNFEYPWINSGANLEENLRLEQEEIRKVRGVIENFVAKMAENRKKWKTEYDTLHEEFGQTSSAPSIISPLRRKAYRRHSNLERIYGDLPERATYATRDVHRKTNGGLAAKFRVREDLESDLAKGLFDPGATYDAVIRCSNGNPKAQADNAPDARGFAVKLLRERTLPNDDTPDAVVKQWLGGLRDQEIDPVEINRQGLLDILTINFPCYFINDPPGYSDVNEPFLKITNDEDALFEHLFSDANSVFFSGMSRWERELALNVNGSIIYHPFYQKYYSMAPSRLGKKDDTDRTAVKYLWEPCRGGEYDELIKTNNPPWADLHIYAHPIRGTIKRTIFNSFPPDLKENRNHLRSMIARSLDPRAFEQDPKRPPVCFDLKVQKYIDETHTSIENTTSVWLESEEQREMWLRKPNIPADEKAAVKTRKIAPFRTIGTLTISPLPLAGIEPDENGVPHTGNRRYIEDLSYNPWNNVPDEHRPLGIVQRMKRRVYAGSRNTRFQVNVVENVLRE